MRLPWVVARTNIEGLRLDMQQYEAAKVSLDSALPLFRANLAPSL